MTVSREEHTATLLNDGTVSIAGGSSWPGRNLPYAIPAAAEIYHPAVLTPAPALYSLSGDALGQGAIWNSRTGQIASSNNPAFAGDVLAMYTTSLIAGGVIGGVIPPQVAAGGRLAEVLFFGDAPGYPGLQPSSNST